VIYGRPYHCQSQGRVEQVSQTLKAKIAKTFGSSNEHVSKLAKTIAAYNSTFYSAIKVTLFQAFRGRLPPQISLIHAPEMKQKKMATTMKVQ
jgi:hypothetical protein